MASSATIGGKVRPTFYPGLHMLSHARHFQRCMISVNRLERRVSDFQVNEWIMDSGAFTRIASGKGHLSVAEYAAQITRWAKCGTLLAAISQDYMCEPFILGKTGLTVAEHQRLTIERYDALLAQDTGVYVMPVIQGYQPGEYVDHLRQYGDRLTPGTWVGVGSVCKRNSSPAAVEATLLAIKTARPDLRLHGFGLKQTALASGLVNVLLTSCDSMAWSFAARREGRDANCWQEAEAYRQQVELAPVQGSLLWS